MTNELNEPILDGAAQAPETMRIRGILAQVRADTSLHPDMNTEDLLRTRLADAGITVNEHHLQQLLDQAGAPPTQDMTPSTQTEHQE